MAHLNSDNEKHELLKHLFIKYFNPLVQNALKYVAVFDDAEEIVQDVFVKVWYELDNLPHHTDFKAYLYRSVYNSCMNFLKHKKVTGKYYDYKVRDSAISETDNLSDYEKDEINCKVDEAINLLPENWREVFLMSRFDGLKYYEIADKLGISQKTVEKYISKSLQILREKLKDFIHFLLIINHL